MRALGHAALFGWAFLFAAVTAALARSVPLGPGGAGLGALAPDLSLVLLVAVAARAERGDARAAAIVVAVARAAQGVDSPFALVAGMWLVVELVAWARGRLRLEGRAVRALLVAASTAALTGWLAAVARVRAPTPVPAEAGALDLALAAALATGLVAFAAGALPARLPGCRALWQEVDAWERVGPVRS